MNNKIRFIITLLICVLIAAVFMTIKPKQLENKNKNAKSSLLRISAMKLSKGTYSYRETFFGEAKSLNNASLRSQVSAEVQYQSPNFQVGKFVQKDEILIRVEASNYKMELSNAELQLANAKLAYENELIEVEEVKNNWKDSKIKPSEMALRQPHLEIAKMQLQTAKDAVELAKVNLAYTEIRAPFSGVITQKNINVGETAFTGEQVAVLQSSYLIEVPIQLSDDKISSLSIENCDVRVKSNSNIWTGRLDRISNFYDEKTRMRTAFVHIKNDSKNKLLPGTFVEVEIFGKKMENLIEIPKSSHTNDMLVWFIDSDSKLRSSKVVPEFQKNDNIYISNFNENYEYIALYPNDSFTNETVVEPVLKSEEE
jgi:RND family efflux transporter MFP subunit